MQARLLTDNAGDEAPPAAYRVADELLRRFGLGSALRVDVVAGGLLNQNLVAVTARGGFFLKGYRYPDPAPIAREHRLIRHAFHSGIPAHPPLAAPDGATYLRVGGRFWAVYPLIKGEQPSPGQMTAKHAAEMGRVLAHIHVALAGLTALEIADYPAKPRWDSTAASAEMAEYEAEIAKRPALDPFDQHALSSFAYRRTLMAGGIQGPEAFDTLPAHLLHGDYHERNLIFDQHGRITSVLDWELAKVGPRAWEIIRTLDYALPLATDLESGGPLQRAFLHAYAAVAPLAEEECVAMPELYWAMQVHTLWPYEEHYRKGSARTDKATMQDLDSLHWWATHREEVAQALLAALASAPQQRVST
jgi:homoserine kinase type II